MNPPKPTQPNPTHWVGSVFKERWVGLDHEIIFLQWVGLGWVRVMKFTNLPNLTRPTHI